MGCGLPLISCLFFDLNFVVWAARCQCIFLFLHLLGLAGRGSSLSIFVIFSRINIDFYFYVTICRA